MWLATEWMVCHTKKHYKYLKHLYTVHDIGIKILFIVDFDFRNYLHVGFVLGSYWSSTGHIIRVLSSMSCALYLRFYYITIPVSLTLPVGW